MRLRAVFIVLLVCAIASAHAVAAGGTIMSSTRTFRLAEGKSATFKLAYPDALQFGASQYRGAVQLLRSPKAHGTKPSLAKVHILSRGSCLGGSDFCVKIRNRNGSGTAPVRIKITAYTQLPCGPTKVCPLNSGPQ